MRHCCKRNGHRSKETTRLNPLTLALATAKPALATAAPAVPKAVASPLAAPLLAPPTPAPLKTMVAQHWPWLTHTVAGIFVCSAVALVLLLAVQTTKQEGLTGSIGGRVESAYRGRLGADEQLKRWTGFAAVAFVVTAFILSLTGI
jgi:protein translocase SecG subunit